MHVLVTGAAGFIGQVLVRELAARGHAVRGTDRNSMDHLPLADAVEGDLAEPSVARAAVADVEFAYHLAAARGDFGISEEQYHHDNVEATRSLLAAGAHAGVSEWVFYSSVGAMGPSDIARDETAELTPTVPYGRTKAKAEQLFREYAAGQAPARVTIIRPSAVYGPENPPNTNIYRLIEAIDSGRFAMVGDGETLKTTSYIDNLIEATFFLSNRMSDGVQTFIYVDEPVLSTGELVEQIHRLLGASPPSWSIPVSVARSVASVSDLVAQITGIDFPITAARIEKFCTPTVFDGGAIRELGFEQPVSNRDALRKTVEWHRKKNADG